MIELDWEQVHDSVGGFTEGLDPGVVQTTEQALVAGLTVFADPMLTDIYRSTDNGDTWEQVAQIRGQTQQGCKRFLNLPENIIIFPVCELDDNTIKIYRTADAGLNWEVIKTYQGPENPPFRDFIANAGITYNRNSLILGGRYQSPSQGGFQNFVRSEDKGVTWEFAGAIEEPGGGPWPSAFANAADGRILCGTTDMSLRISNDYGATWEATGTLPTPTGFFGGEAHAITWMTHDIALYAAGGNSSAETDWPYLYRSIDGGNNWTHIEKDDIAGWPPTANTRKIWEVKRLTKDCAIFFADQQAAGSPALSRLTIDGGLTWPIVPTGMAFPDGVGARSFSACVTAEDGSLLVTSFDVTVTGAHRRIWKGTLTV